MKNDNEIIEKSNERYEVFYNDLLEVRAIKALEREHGIKARRGRFTEKEADIAKKLADRFIADYKLTSEEFAKLLYTGKNKRDSNTNERIIQLLSRIVKKLNNGRYLLSVLHFLHKEYNPRNKNGPWSEEEDIILRKQYFLHGPRWSKISEPLNRTALNCKDRWKRISLRKKVGPWSPQETEKLIQVVKKVMNEGKEGPFWNIVASHIPERNASQCISKWTSIQSCKKPIYGERQWTTLEDYLLMNFIYDSSNFSDENDIQWEKIHKNTVFNGFLIHKLKAKWKFLKKKYSNIRKKNGETIPISEFLKFAIIKLHEKIFFCPNSDIILTDSNKGYVLYYKKRVESMIIKQEY